MSPKSIPRVALLALAAVFGCGSTGGALLKLPLQVGGVDRDSSQPMTFANPLGWTITLTTASIALGPFYVNHNPPDTQNFRSGTVIIEATEQVVVDVLDPTLFDVPGGADGESGTGVAVEIELYPPDDTQSSASSVLLAGNVGIVAGTATKNGVTIPFSGPIVINENLVTATTPLLALERVNGAQVDLDFTTDAQTLVLRVDPTDWFAQVDFGSLVGGAGTSLVNGVYTWDETSTFLNLLDQGVKSTTGVYDFTLTP